MRKQDARLLDCAHFHVVFTLPDKLGELWPLNQKIMTQILFSASKETLMEMLADEKHLGVRIGIISTLHTWTKTRLLHPHVHCIVTGGGLTENGEWKDSNNGILLPGRAVTAVYRGKTRAFLLKALKKGDLVLPEGMSPQQFKNLLNKLGRKKWNVRICEKYSHGSGVANYMARYVRGGSIGNKRIEKIENGKVTFNAGRGETVLTTVTIEELIRRWIQHVPEPRSVRARSYGLYAHGKKAALDECRRLLGQQPVKPVEKIDWRDLFEQWGKNSGKCPVCGKPLIPSDVFGPNEAPTRTSLENARPPDLESLEAAA